ncbi:hypothetical protein NE237_023632 [Protea cynaroides]|uniref:Uncharacterized protein n=1 Tax=Protea cynaroides TaxID=273540 RepID=A0A9Q0K6Q7_9MAGN|nr:hypothetical protein NE237_023632 [Protea cynaroides]
MMSSSKSTASLVRFYSDNSNLDDLLAAKPTFPVVLPAPPFLVKTAPVILTAPIPRKDKGKSVLVPTTKVAPIRPTGGIVIHALPTPGSQDSQKRTLDPESEDASFIAHKKFPPVSKREALKANKEIRTVSLLVYKEAQNTSSRVDRKTVSEMVELGVIEETEGAQVESEIVELSLRRFPGLFPRWNLGEGDSVGADPSLAPKLALGSVLLMDAHTIEKLPNETFKVQMFAHQTL